METHLVPAEEAPWMAHSKEITDGPSALALLWCERLLRYEPHRSQPPVTYEKH